MARTTPMTPEVREQVVRMLSASTETFLRSLTKRYFKKPGTAEARAVQLEAFAVALVGLTKDDPTAEATLLAFASELLEQKEKL